MIRRLYRLLTWPIRALFTIEEDPAVNAYLDWADQRQDWLDAQERARKRKSR